MSTTTKEYKTCGRHKPWYAVCGALWLVCCGTAEQSIGNQANPLTALLSSQFAPELGKGVNNAETRTYAKCVVFPQPQSQPIAFRKRDYTEFSARSRSELNKKMNFSAKMAARGLWGSVSAGFSNFKDIDINQEDFYWVVNARYELAHESIETSSPEFHLSAQAQAILQAGGWKAFKSVCGSRFYVGRTLGAQYALLYEFSSQDDKLIEKLDANAKVSVAFGIDAEGQFSKALSSAQKSSRLKVHSEIVGGDDSISDKAESPAELKQELAKLRQALSKRQGDVLDWEVLEYDIFAEVRAAREREMSDDFTADAVDAALGHFYDRFINNQSNIAYLRKLHQQSSGSEPWYIFSQAQRAQIDALRAAFEHQNLSIGQRAAQCMQNADPNHCGLEGLPELPLAIPTPERDLTNLGEWDFYLALSEMGSSAIQLVGIHPRGQVPRLFQTDNDLWEGAVGIFTVARGADGQNASVVIGTATPRVTASGQARPALCLDEFATVCNLRIVEDPAFTEPDGLPATKLILSVFNDDGTIMAKKVFRSQF